MIGAPASELFIDELAVFVLKRHGQYWERKHVLASDLRYDFHEDLLMFDKLFDTVDEHSAVWERDASEKSFAVLVVEDRHVDECRLVDAHKGLIQAVYELLEALS